MNKDELKQFRERIGLNQGELSKALSVAGNTVSRWELGTREIPKFLPLALETIERRLSESKTDSTAGSQIKSTVSSKPKSIEKKSTVGSSDLSATDNEYTMTTADAGKALGLKPRTVLEKVEKGLLKGYQNPTTKHWFFRQWDVGEFQMTRGKE
jgi:DNA-binding XRE family transcriptional regulator